MTDVIRQIGASKLAISIGLAGLAWIAARRRGNPSLAHGLWLLPLAVLLVPPFVSIPVGSAGIDPVGSVAAIGSLEAQPSPFVAAILLDWLRNGAKEGLAWLWALGTASVLGWTLVRTLRFHRSLLSASEPAPPEIQRPAREIARRLGLAAAPAVYATHAQLSPMVWWAGAWWARRRLRASEELCCDALAVAATGTQPRTYAGALLRVIDFISKTPVPGPLTFASTINRCGRPSWLERRFRVIMTNRTSTPTPRRRRIALRCGAVCLLAGGLVYCTDQSNLTSIAPAVVPANEEAIARLDRGDPAAARPPQALRTLGDRIEAIAMEEGLPRELAETLRAVGDRALSGEPVHLLGADGQVAGLRGGAPSLFVAVTPDNGSGDYKAVALNLAGLRASLSEGVRSEEVLDAEIARYLGVRQNSAFRFLRGMHLECAADEGGSPSLEAVTSGKMTCSTTESSDGRFHVETLRFK